MKKTVKEEEREEKRDGTNKLLSNDMALQTDPQTGEWNRKYIESNVMQFALLI